MQCKKRKIHSRNEGFSNNVIVGCSATFKRLGNAALVVPKHCFGEHKCSRAVLKSPWKTENYLLINELRSRDWLAQWENVCFVIQQSKVDSARSWEKLMVACARGNKTRNRDFSNSFVWSLQNDQPRHLLVETQSRFYTLHIEWKGTKPEQIGPMQMGLMVDSWPYTLTMQLYNNNTSNLEELLRL